MKNNIFNRAQTNFELQNIAQKLNLPVKIVMKDELKGSIPDGNYIVNLQNHNQNGSHWTGLFKHKNKYYYADSFGIVLPQTLIDNLNINPINVYFLDKQIQDINSQLCGFFALYFLFKMNTNYGVNIKLNLKSYIETFDLTDIKNNNQIIKYIFNNIV